MEQENKLEILLVEDDPASTEFFVSCFAKEYNILCAASGEEALELFRRKTNIAMVLSDQFMPGMSGVELLSKIYEQDEKTIRIITTGFINTSDIIDAVNKGRIYQFIAKPWEIVQIRMVLSQAAYTWKLRRENLRLQEQILTKNHLLTQTNEQLQASEKDLRNLSTALFTAREDEQQRIAMELHDELGQSLAALKMQTCIMENDFREEQQEQKERISTWSGKLRDSISQIIEEVRLLSKNLSPVIIDDLGLDAAIQHLVDNFTGTHGITCSFCPAPLTVISSVDGKRIVYRLVQETMNNICKHAHATHIDFSIKVDKIRVRLELTDNGKGFDFKEMVARPPSHRGIGFTAMSERVKMLGGNVDIQSDVGKGTTVVFTIPVDFNVNRNTAHEY
ncbi:MAG: response regulator [Candidatus Electrothrix sp. AR4]|nr:response regulator [Candidatus Electrothrix sp. AR4]